MDSNQNAKIKRTIRALILAQALTLSGVPASYAGSPTYSDTEIQSVMNGDDHKIHDLRSQEINQLRITLGRRIPTNRRADLYVRLAEIYLEAYRAQFLLEGRVHENRIEKGTSDPLIDRSHSKPFLALGIKACQDILKIGIPHQNLDQIYYFLGFYYGELGDEQQSLRYFTTLTQQYPGSPYLVEAYRELGDAAYLQLQYRKALSYYELAVKTDKRDSLPRVQHKLAWTHYRLKQYDQAIAAMKEAIAGASKNGEKFLSLREEGLRDMAVFMTEGGRVDEAIVYFQGVAGDQAFFPKILERLGRQYERNVQPIKATQVYETLLKTHPDDEAAFRVRVKLIDLDVRRALYNVALRRLDGFKSLSGSEPETQTAAQNLRALIRRTATEKHELFRKKGARSALNVAEDFYQAYLKVFLAKDDPRNETSEIQMYLADVKRELGKSKEASELYRSVVESKDKRYAKEAASLWAASLVDAIKRAGAGTSKKTDAPGEPSALEKEFIEAADDLQDSLGEMPEGKEAALRAAQVLAGYKSTRGQAIKRIKKMINQWPKSPQAQTAARLWLQIYSDQLPASAAASIEKDAELKDAYSDLQDAVKDLHANVDLMAADQAAGGKLKLLLTQQETRFKVGEIAAQERGQDFTAAGQGYEKFAAEAIQTDVAEKAYANAVASFLKSGDSEGLNRVIGAWFKRYPKSIKVTESVRSSATVALIQGRFDQAIQLFERLGREGGDPTSLLTAARLYEGTGNLEQARALWVEHIKGFGKKLPVSLNVYLMLAQAYEAENQDAQAIQYYQLCLDSPLAAECGARLADLHLRNQETDKAKALYRKVAGDGTSAGSKKSAKKGAKPRLISSPFVGYARYRLAELLEAEAKFEALQLPDAQLKKALNQRLEFLEPLSRAYMSAVEAGGPWGVAALDRLAHWALAFADEVDRIPPPSGADATRKQQFKQSLLSVSEPLRKKALETWKSAYDRAAQSEILSPSLPAIVDRLADAKLKSPARAQGPRARFRLAGMPSSGGPEGRLAALEKVRNRLEKNAKDATAWVDYGNLLWGEGKPLLARLAYDQASTLDPKNAAAINNRGVIASSGVGQEDWFRVTEAQALFKEALKYEEQFLPAKFNRAVLLNYYRVFSAAKPLWDQLIAKAPSIDVYDGLGVALQGLGEAKTAEAAFHRADDSNAFVKRFARAYHRAALQAMHGGAGIDQCLKLLAEIDEAAISGFEKEAVENLKRTCTQWKTAQ